MTGKLRIDRRGFLRNAGSAALGAAAAGSVAQFSRPARAQDKFPARDISWIIYQAPGGSIDTTARIMQPYLEKHGVKTSLDYVLGAGGRVARSKLHTARPDGYVMMSESAPGAAIDEVIGRAGYKASEFIAIFGWSVVSWQLCVKKDSPIQTFQQFVEECHKRRVVVGTIGRSGSSHIQLAGAFAKAFEDKMLWEQMQKAGEYLKLLTRAQVEDMVAKQTEVIEKYKDVLG